MTRPPALHRSPRGILLPALVNLTGIGAMTAPAVAGLPLAVDALVPVSDRTSTLAVAATLGAIAATVANPVFGFLSDRTRGRSGRRHPWIVGGAVAGLGAIILLTSAPSPAVLLLAWVLVQIAYNALLAAVAGLLSDTVPEGERTAASGTFAAAAFLGAVPPLILAGAFPDHLVVVTLVMPVLAIVAAVICAALLPENPRPTPTFTADASRARRRVFGFAPVWLSRFVQSLAFGLVTSFMLYLVADRVTGSTVSATAPTAMTTLAGGGALVGAALLTGWVGARANRIVLLVTASVGLAVAAVLRAAAADLWMLTASAVLGGTAMGIFFTVNLAIALDRVPAGDGGRYLGALNVADTLPQMLVPLLAAWLVTLGPQHPPPSPGADGYTVLYLTAAGVSLAGLAVLPFLRLDPPGDAAVLEQSPRGEHA